MKISPSDLVKNTSNSIVTFLSYIDIICICLIGYLFLSNIQIVNYSIQYLNINTQKYETIVTSSCNQYPLINKLTPNKCDIYNLKAKEVKGYSCSFDNELKLPTYRPISYSCRIHIIK